VPASGAHQPVSPKPAAGEIFEVAAITFDIPMISN
jgi:hypothetical protein